ncbi:reverse transcriptase domain-containing protein [Leptospira venezuelensis]|uniref:reverse transcriptase domain-containing protein n=2 Tax=Leptospira venezuelensis TaxID=1958811 RepID=UPI001319D45D|nr:reverse transcriptase domain-containing protein [Leptospira venezuelensis]
MKESIVTPSENIQFNELIRDLYYSIKDHTYHPQKPREYIIANKHNYVARIIPTFSARDYCLYYFVIKMLEAEIAVNRVEGTYGGWTLGNQLRLKENEEEIYLNDYAMPSSFNPFLWMQNWQEFQKKAYSFSRSGEYKYIIKYDIANFYNSINLNLLIRKIFLITPFAKRFYAELLSHFLFSWNKKIEGYVSKNIGLPQDEIGDCSRILANFYLQEYDEKIFNLCKKYGAKYLRYADDQLIFANSEEIAKRILFEASKDLFKMDLIINSSKVKEFPDMQEFNDYWAFDIFDLLADKENEELINKGIEIYYKRKDDEVEFRSFSVLKKIVSLDFDKILPHLKYRVLSELFNQEFLSNSDYWMLSKIYKNVGANDRRNLLEILDSLIPKIHFNSYHYNLIVFYQKNNLNFNEKKVRSFISEYSF